MIEEEPYTTGYGKPPKAYQFKLGKSGNPKGRPKKSKEQKSFEAVVLAQMNVMVTVMENGIPKKMTLWEWLIRATISNAIKGDAHAMKTLFKWTKDFSPSFFSGVAMEYRMTSEAYKMIEVFKQANKAWGYHDHSKDD
jgi:hypothetical protein